MQQTSCCRKEIHPMLQKKINLHIYMYTHERVNFAMPVTIIYIIAMIAQIIYLHEVAGVNIVHIAAKTTIRPTHISQLNKWTPCEYLLTGLGPCPAQSKQRKLTNKTHHLYLSALWRVTLLLPLACYVGNKNTLPPFFY